MKSARETHGGGDVGVRECRMKGKAWRTYPIMVWNGKLLDGAGPWPSVDLDARASGEIVAVVEVVDVFADLHAAPGQILSSHHANRRSTVWLYRVTAGVRGGPQAAGGSVTDNQNKKGGNGGGADQIHLRAVADDNDLCAWTDDDVRDDEASQVGIGGDHGRWPA